MVDNVVVLPADTSLGQGPGPNQESARVPKRLVRAVLDGAGVKVYLQRDNLGRRMREHRLMVVKYRLKENLGSKKQLATPAAQALTALKYLATKKGPLAAPVGCQLEGTT